MASTDNTSNESLARELARATVDNALGGVTNPRDPDQNLPSPVACFGEEGFLPADVGQGGFW